MTVVCKLGRLLRLQALVTLVTFVTLVYAGLGDWRGLQMDCNLDDGSWMTQIQVALGSPWRATKTLPPGLRIATSSISGAGLGVFSDVFISKFTWLGPYEGEVVFDEADISVYAWEMWRGDELHYYLDGRDERTSTWPRYVNCARNCREENVAMFQCFDQPYYVTVRDVTPGQELLVYYGDEDAQALGIDIDSFFDGCEHS